MTTIDPDGDLAYLERNIDALDRKYHTALQMVREKDDLIGQLRAAMLELMVATTAVDQFRDLMVPQGERGIVALTYTQGRIQGMALDKVADLLGLKHGGMFDVRDTQLYEALGDDVSLESVAAALSKVYYPDGAPDAES